MWLPWLNKKRSAQSRSSKRDRGKRLCQRCERAKPLALIEKEIWYSCIICGDAYCPDCIPHLNRPPAAIPEKLCDACSGFVRPDNDAFTRL
jgi:hypothetical protein